MLKYLSVCSGIEAASVAWEPLGFAAAGFSEIESFPSTVLAHRWPQVTNYGDMTLLHGLVAAGKAPAPDILVGGTPCQAFSVAGLRHGLSDHRGALTLSFVRLANAIDDVRIAAGKPECIIVWENVPGVLSSKDNAFGHFLAGLAGEDQPLQPPGKRWAYAGVVLGPQRAVAWRTFDAQYFGLAQRRRRVFVVASARNGFDPCTVLFESEGMRRDTAPSREAREEVAGTLDARTTGGGFPGTDGAANGHVVATLDANYGKLQGASGQDANHGHSHLVPVAFGQNRQSGPVETSHALNGHAGPHGRLDFETETFLVQSITGDITHALNTANNGKGCSEDGTRRGVPVVTAVRDVAQTITQNYGKQPDNSDTALGPNVAIHDMAVRRLMPTECETLQGFPKNHTLIPVRGKPAADGPRYKAIGNSMAVPCMRWIGSRILHTIIDGGREV